ncbi:DUF308 domain-containing protein [Candidatus Saccharibacteria bacterium]|nr:DUF308 domain-containing protein [Candidatus Saccharibacteria bacterium]
METAVVENYKKNWWMYLVSGIVTLLFGLVTVINPAVTFLSLSFFFGLFLVLTGGIDMVNALTSIKTKSLWFLQLGFGALVAIFGVYILQRPKLSLATFVIYAALALLVKAVVHLVEAFDSNYDGMYRTWQVLAAVVSALAATFIWRYPVKGTLAFVWVLGVFALINGPLMIAFALEAKHGFASKRK